MGWIHTTEEFNYFVLYSVKVPRILTVEKIANMSDGSLKLYRRKLHNIRHILNNCTYDGGYIELTGKALDKINALWYIFGAVAKEWDKRHKEDVEDLYERIWRERLLAAYLSGSKTTKSTKKWFRHKGRRYKE